MDRKVSPAIVFATVLSLVTPSATFSTLPGSFFLGNHGAPFISESHAHQRTNSLNLVRHWKSRPSPRTTIMCDRILGRPKPILGDRILHSGSATVLRSSVQFSSVPNLCETRQSSTSICKGRGSKGSLYFARGWTVHSADHDWERRCSEISGFYGKAKAPSREIRYRSKMILGGFAVMVASFPAMALLVKPVAGLNLVAKMFANVVAGMTAISIVHPVESIMAGGKQLQVSHLFKGLGDALAFQMLLRPMTILAYTYFHHAVCATAPALAAACEGLAGVALASLATGVVAALVSAPMEAAGEMKGEAPLGSKLKVLAGKGAFTAEGLYGGLRCSLLLNVVAFEAFFLAYAAMPLLWPSLAGSLAGSWSGTAARGAVAGVVSAAAATTIDGMRKVESIRQRVRDWWRGRKCIRSDVQDVVDECYTAATFNSLLCVSYKAVLTSLI